MLAPLLLHATVPVVPVKARRIIYSWSEASCERHPTGTLPNGAPLPGPASQSLGLAPVRPFGPVAKTDGSAAAAAAAADGEQSTAPMMSTDASVMQSGSGHVSRHIWRFCAVCRLRSAAAVCGVGGGAGRREAGGHRGLERRRPPCGTGTRQPQPSRVRLAPAATMRLQG